MTEIISVRFRPGGKQYYFDPVGLTVAEKVTVDPATRQTVHELVSDIAIMAICAPQKYKAYLADSRSIDAAYTMDGDEAVIRQK